MDAPWNLIERWVFFALNRGRKQFLWIELRVAQLWTLSTFLKYKLSGDGKEFVEALCIIFAVSKLYSSSIKKILS